MNPIQRVFIEIVLPRMGIAPSDRILDLGCGDGWACRAMAALAREGMVVGIDSNGDHIREARRLSATFDNVLYIEAEAEEIPWQDNFFSHAVVIGSITHVRDAAATLRHLHRVMSPGGQLWIMNEAARETGPAEFAETAAAGPRADELTGILSACGMEGPRVETVAMAPGHPAFLLIAAGKAQQG